MADARYGHEGREERIKRQLKVVYARKTHERQVFMEELKQFRRHRDRQTLRSLIEAVGPKWYQALSLRQRNALDSLRSSIYQDLLEARPHRTAAVMRDLGIFPRPSNSELLNCIYYGRHDPKEMLAQLYLATFGYPIEGKRASYCLNARLILSAILYLGLDNLIELLKKKFAPEESTVATPKKRKPKPEKTSSSPYLQKMVAVVYEPPRPRTQKPLPMPNLEELNEPYEEEPVMPKPPPPPPPPPPPKKRLSRTYCDQVAGVYTLLARPIPQDLGLKKGSRTTLRKMRSSKVCLSDGTFKKKVYGMDISMRKKGKRRKKPVPPTTGLWNYQYTINGVCQVRGRAVFILGNITSLPAQGEYIHGGYTDCKGTMINIHCGFRGLPPLAKPDPCDCVKKWHDTVFDYIKANKCYCGHNYDFGNEGAYPVDELPFFEKPTRTGQFGFNLDTVYNTDDQQLLVTKEFKKHWETDSILHEDDGTVAVKKEPTKSRKKKRTSNTCLGSNPAPEDYLKCALRLMRRQNVAARLPDLHLVPELKEWMRHRLHGPLTNVEKKQYLRKSGIYWTMFTSLASKGFGHVFPPKDIKYSGHTTWVHKQNLNDKFRQYISKYKLMMYRTHAYINNLMWRSMFQAEFPCETFRKIYFSYLVGRLEDLQLLHPYNMKESIERKLILAKKRYVCLPNGYERQA